MATSIESRNFGYLPTGECVEAWTLTGAGGLVLEAITYGGIVTRLLAPDCDGQLADLVLGYRDLDGYISDPYYFGAIVGRVAGRISRAKFTIDETVYRLSANDPPNHLHGGDVGFSRRLWTATPVERPDGAPSLRLSRRGQDGEDGYPGNVDITVTYTATADNVFLIETKAVSDQTTPFCPTHHSYFNLAGEDAGSIADHELQVNSSNYIPASTSMGLLGRLEPVAGSTEDFIKPQRLGAVISSLFQEHGALYNLRQVGLDQNCEIPLHAARLTHCASGRALDVWTTAPYIQVYTAAGLDGSVSGKSGISYPRHAALCLECQGYPDGANAPHLGDIMLYPGQEKLESTAYAFSCMPLTDSVPLRWDRRNALHNAPPMPRKRDFRIGVLGSGFIVDQCHLVSYERAGFNPVGIASRNRENAAQIAARHGIARVYESYEALLDDPTIEVLDIAIPPQSQLHWIKEACARGTAMGILAQKPLALNYADAAEAVRCCEQAGIQLSVNQNMRFDPTVYAAWKLLQQGVLGTPVFATIDMRGIPHWQSWQAETGSATLKVMSNHHFDCMRFWFGEPEYVFCSSRPDPRTSFTHSDGICTTILEYANGLRCVVIDDVWTGPAKEGCPASLRIEWRIEGLDGLAIGDIGWCKEPYTTPSTMRLARKGDAAFEYFTPTQSWFPDAFAGTMAALLIALETGLQSTLNARDNLQTIALVEAASLSSIEHRVTRPEEIIRMHQQRSKP